ncbi:MAG: Rrf2 family transcriptional regulator [Gammaproteobacteria bacterium]|nr:Rrf2 family transcriptional regulator [Gammaproteobacteria bacterium]
MQITRYSDYSLRVLMYLALNSEKLSNISEIAQSFDISRSHLNKVVNNLVKSGYINSRRGRNGGLTLAYDADTILVGGVIRDTEHTLDIIKCAKPVCPFKPVCKLKPALNEATESFLNVLDTYTLSDITNNENFLKRMLS